MTHLTSPAAEPAEVSKSMADIIDSLKRLERIGSESSKTVEKVIQAAAELKRNIASQYANSSGTHIKAFSILSKIAKEKECSLVEAAKSIGLDYKRVERMEYTIEWRHSHSYSVRRGGSDLDVSANRETALAFANDLANGLLTLIEYDLLARQSQEERALTLLREADASEKPEVEKLPDEF
jgi:molybdenum-dependent DNA-binding transcriptional regulator ModE